MLSWACWIQIEHLILTAMMTEVGIETIKVTRLTESDDDELESWTLSLETLMKTLVVLFERRRCQTLGFLRYLLVTLKAKPLTIIFPKGNTKTIAYRDITPTVLDTCYNAMVEWMHLLVPILQAENPKFEFAYVLPRVLQLKTDIKEINVMPGSEFDTHCRRIAKALAPHDTVKQAEVVGQVKEQLADVQPLAKHIKDVGEVHCEREAWGMSTSMKIRNSKNVGRAHLQDDQRPYDVLAELVHFNSSWSQTSSGVERLIGLCKFVKGKHGNAADESRVNDVLEVLCADDFLLQGVVKKSCNLFLELYGMVRQTNTKSRLQCGSTKRKLQNEEKVTDERIESEAAFLRKRAKQVTSAVAELDTGTLEIAAKRHCWSSEDAAAEAKFNKKKCQRKLLKEYAKPNHGSLLPEEIESINAAEREEFLKKRASNTADLFKKYGKRRGAIAKKCSTRVTLDGQKVCFDNWTKLLDTAKVHVATQWKMVWVMDLLEADVVVAGDLNKFQGSDKFAIVSALKGLTVMAEEHFLSLGRHGARLVLQPFVARKKTWYFSPSVQEKHPRTMAASGGYVS